MRVEIFTMGGIVRDVPDKVGRNLIKQGQAAAVVEGAEKVTKKKATKTRKAARKHKNKMRTPGENK